MHERDSPAGVRASGQRDRARIGRIHPRDDLDQRRFTGAVGPEQCVHLTGANLEVNIVEHKRTTERLREADDLEQRLALVKLIPSPVSRGLSKREICQHR